MQKPGHLSSKSAWANTLRDPILKKKSRKRTGGVAQDVGLEFKPQYHKKERKKREPVSPPPPARKDSKSIWLSQRHILAYVPQPKSNQVLLVRIIC
jgi:hypothetical protein